MRSARPTQKVPGQPEMHSKTLTEKKELGKKNEEKEKKQLFSVLKRNLSGSLGLYNQLQTCPTGVILFFSFAEFY